MLDAPSDLWARMLFYCRWAMPPRTLAYCSEAIASERSS
jgi:hypothetical protein